MTEQPLERYLLRTFYVGVSLLTLYVLYLGMRLDPLRFIAGSAILAASVVPFYLWCAGRAPGLPIFPALAGTYSWTFGLPVLNDHPALARYDDAILVQSALTIIGFLCLSTAVWYTILNRPVTPPRTYLAVPTESSSPLFLSCLALGCAFQIASMAGLLWNFGPSVYSLLRAVSLSLETVGVTILSYRLGRRDLSPVATAMFVGLFLVFLIFNAAALMLAPSMALLLLAVGIFTLARGKFPLRVVAVAAVVFSVLHAGKDPMRAEYWGKGKAVELWTDLAYYPRWFTYGLERLPSSASGERIDEVKKASVTDRASLIQMLLLVQSKSPDEKPFLYGRTYGIIPELLVPRILVKEKVWSHEGTYILSVHYGLQTRSATLRTTIGFGLLPEAYANFGYAGVAGLALLLGIGCGLVTRWSSQVPVVSLRGLYSLMILGLVMQTENTAGVAISSLFQASVTLFGLAMLTMRSHEQTTESSSSSLHTHFQHAAPWPGGP